MLVVLHTSGLSVYLRSESEAKALYSEGRAVMQNRLSKELKLQLEPCRILVEDVLLRGLKLQQQLVHSIELKAQAEQESARMEFVLQKELPSRHCLPPAHRL